MKILIASSSGFSRCEIPGRFTWNMCNDVSIHEWNQESLCEVLQYMRNWFELPVVLPIWALLLLQTLLYSHSSQRQDIDDNVHRLLSFCYIIGMFDCYFDILFLHYWPWFRFSSINPAIINLFKINNGNTRTKWEICSKLTIKTPERS